MVFSPDCIDMSEWSSGLSGLTPCLPLPWGNEKGTDRIHRTGWLDAQIWSPVLAPPLAIDLIPLGLSFLRIIINKITIETSLGSLPVSGPVLKACKPPSWGPNTQRHWILLPLFCYGAKNRKKVPSQFPLSFFPPQCVPMKILSHVMAVKSYVISTARKDRDFIISILFFTLSFETVL